MFKLGVLFANEGEIEQAKVWYLRGAEAGNSDSMHNLGNLFAEEGEIEQAKVWRQLVPLKVTPTYTIGDTGPAGGKIFITPSTFGNTTGKYFEAAPADLSTTMAWCSHATTLLGASGTAIGTGQSNTEKMLLIYKSGAAFSASAYRSGTSSIYSDWFLPSKDELNEMYLNRASIGGFATNDYWSSSENYEFSAWSQDFSNGYQYNFDDGNGLKTNTFYVRPVRAFS